MIQLVCTVAARPQNTMNMRTELVNIETEYLQQELLIITVFKKLVFYSFEKQTKYFLNVVCFTY